MASLTILIGLLAMAVAIAYYRIAAARKEEQAMGGARRLPGPKGKNQRADRDIVSSRVDIL